MYHEKFDTNTRNCAGHILKVLFYQVKNCSAEDHNFKEVCCYYKYDDHILCLFIFFPSNLYKNDSIFIEKSKKFVETIIKNCEIVNYSKRFLALKSYSFKTPLPYKAFISARGFRVNNEVIKDSNKGLFTWFKGLNPFGKIATTALSLMIVAGITGGILYSTGIFNRPIAEPVYDITIDCGDGTIDGSHILNLNGKSVIEVPPNPKKDGYTLEGWYKTKRLKNNSYNEYIFEDKITEWPYKLTANSTMYAKWELNKKITKTVYFETDVEDCKINPRKVVNGAKLSTIGTIEEPKKKDYKFTKWYYDKDHHEPFDDQHDKEIYDDITLYAGYEQVAWPVTFITDGTWPDESQKISENTYVVPSCSVLENEPVTVKDGYTFQGWKDKNDKLVKFPYTIKNHINDLPLTATFTKHYSTYTVRFFEKPGDTTPYKTIENCSRITNAPTPTRADYHFNGWTESGSTSIIDFASYPGGYEVLSDKDFYGSWTQDKFNGTKLYAVKSDDLSSNPTLLKEYEESIATINEAPIFTDDRFTDYYQDKWYKNVDDLKAGKNEIAFPYELKNDNTSLYCKYVRNAYTVKFFDENASSSDTPLSIINHVVKLSQNQAPQITKENYSLSWTYKDAQGKLQPLDLSSEVTLSTIASSDTLNIFAKWTKNKYKLTLMYPEEDKKEPVYINETKDTKISLSSLNKYKYNKDCYTCKGWSYNDYTKTQTIISEDIELNDDKTIYCVYEQSSFVMNLSYVSFIDGKYKEIASASSLKNFSKAKHKVDELSKENIITYDSKKYVFSHWEYVESGAKVTDDNFNVSSDLKLRAIYYQSRDLTLKYRYFDGTPIGEDQTIEDVSTVIPSSLTSPAIQDYSVTKWYKKIGTGDEVEINADEQIPVENDMTIIGEYYRSGFTLTFKTIDPDHPSEPETVYNEISHLKSSDVIYENKIKNPSNKLFSGWYEEGKTNPVDFSAGYSISEHTTLHAKYGESATVIFSILDEDYNNGARFKKQTSPTTEAQMVSYTSTEATDYEVFSFDYQKEGYDISYDNHAIEGWYTNKSCESKYLVNFPISKGGTHVIYAKFLATTPKCSVQLNCGDGHFGTSSDKTMLFTPDINSTLGDLVDKSKTPSYIEPTFEDGTKYIFKCWQAYDANVGGYVDLTNDYKFDSNILLTACYEEKVDEPGTTQAAFLSDSWATISIVAEQRGLSGLKSQYNVTSFVGLTKTGITYNGTGDYSALIIGENHDQISNDLTGKKKAALTFQFYKAPVSTVYNPSLYMGKSNNWETSDYRSKINMNVATGAEGEIYNKLDISLKAHVQLVEKQTMRGKNVTDEYKILDTTNDKLFALSANECGLNSSSCSAYHYLDAAAASSTTGFVWPFNADIYVTEGTTYEYFESFSKGEITGSTQKVKNENARNYLIRQNASGTGTKYYLRSPYNSTYNNGGLLGTGVPFVSNKGAFYPSRSADWKQYALFFTDQTSTMAAGFCIGVSTIS